MTPAATYILPIRATAVDTASIEELGAYLESIVSMVEVLVVDGSPKEVFVAHHEVWAPIVAAHRAPDPDLCFKNGKVNGVETGLRLASFDKVVIADADVRYDVIGLQRMVDLLDDVDVVRPQNYFHPRPWHARWDTARRLLNRSIGRDFPGTLGVRRSALHRSPTYDGDVIFENLELIRTVCADGGREAAPLDFFVRRLPPTTRQFRSQRVRQAYDEFARPGRMVAFLAIAPGLVGLSRRVRWAPAAAAAAAITLAEIGRRRDGGTEMFPVATSLLAPLWVAERAVCSWLALGSRLVRGGVDYRGTVLTRSATPTRRLRDLHARAPLRATRRTTAWSATGRTGTAARSHAGS
jgi:hypothetical protein